MPSLPVPNPPIDVLWIARYDYGSGWTLRLHHHSYLQMILFLDGKGVFTVADHAFPIRGGELFLLRPGETHGFRAESLVRTLDVKFRVAPGLLARRLRRAAVVRQWNEPSLRTPDLTEFELTQLYTPVEGPYPEKEFPWP